MHKNIKLKLTLTLILTLTDTGGTVLTVLSLRYPNARIQKFIHYLTEGAPGAIHFLLVINFKAQKRKTKTNTNPIPDPNRYRRRCPDPNARIQKFIHYMATPQRRLHRVTIRNHSRGLDS